ncbi:MAG: Re/Si-specific NAD(P)(+) transhydrogenase subunit alpha [Bryobacteraceae bacterium]|jgi:NAD(P) transhydrogenase subunit alpha
MVGTTVGIVSESLPGERRVAMTPGALSVLKKTNVELLMEAGAGVPAGMPDAEYAEKGVRIGPREEVFASCEVILQVRSLGANLQAGRADLPYLRRGQAVIGFGEPLTSIDAARDLAERGISFLSMELMPRITRAQSMDALSSMATIAGYKAALMAADSLPRMFPMLMTAAGTVAPAHVLVLGAGVAGLQAIATARRLGAVVSGYDIRAAVREQIESIGARFVVLDVGEASAEDKGGYAKAMSEDFYRRQREAMANVVAEQNVVITTAAVPGKRAPILITREMVQRMPPGSVIVDIAAERGGNCELTRPGEVVEERGVQIYGPVNLPSTIPYHASQMYARNIATFLKYLIKDGTFTLNQEDEIVRETLVTHAGEVVHARVREAMGLASLETVS